MNNELRRIAVKIFDMTRKGSRWLLPLSACAVVGCASLPEKPKDIWPWEYGKGQGEPNTGDYIAFRSGVATFGETPAAVKPRKPEPAEQQFSGAYPAPEKKTATGSEPPAASRQETGKAAGINKNGYDFRVSESRSTDASSLLPGMVSPAYDITASNHGNAPVSVVINMDRGAGQNASADKKLPHYAVVPANSERTLLRFSAMRKGSGFDSRYSSVWSIGDYTATHNCPERYRFPFGEKVRAFAGVTDPADATPYTRNAVLFSVPKGTPVLAARKGTVIQIGEGKIDVLHDDSTIGTYYHLEKTAEYAVVGKTVTTDDVIGIAGTSEDNNGAYIQLTVWRPQPTADDQLTTRSKHIGLEAVSFPLPFSGLGNGTVLTKNQPVSRGKLSASNKRAKRK